MIDRYEAADYLRKMALAVELLADQPIPSESLRTAAAALVALDDRGWRAWVATGSPPLPGLGDGLGARVREFARNGTSPELDALLLRVPPGLFDILKIRGIGSERARVLWHEANIVTVSQLRRACQRGRLAALPGFGRSLEAQILAEIQRDHRSQGSWLRREAVRAAEEREEKLRTTKGLLRLERAGELRRGCELVREIVWVGASDDPVAVLGRLASLRHAFVSSETSDTVQITAENEMRQRIVIVDRAHFAARWFLETGSETHTRAVLRRIAGADSAADATAFPQYGWLPESEESIYARCGLQWTPPELREGRSEIAAASSGDLPALIESSDLRGVFHVHTNWSDGRLPVAEMAAAAARQGWEYVGIADHSQSAFYANGLSADRLAAQSSEIRSVQLRMPSIRIFHGVESDILPDGKLDYPDDVLEKLDFVIVSVHSLMDMPSEAMTRRIVRAIGHPCATILAHPSGRLLLEREPYSVDWDQIFEAAAASGTAVEFSTSPERLDLDWRLIRSATQRGVKLCVNPDAHVAAALLHVSDGLATARKGWLAARQVLNTRTLAEMEEYLHAPSQ